MKELISKLRQQKIRLSVDQGQLVVDYDGDMLSDDLILEIKGNKDELIKYLLKYDGSIEYEQIPHLSEASSYVLSAAQKRLWVLSQFEEGLVAYNMPGSIYLNKEINIENFKKAIEATIDRHEILRTVFKEDESREVRQWIVNREDLNFNINCLDYRNDTDKYEKVEVYLANDSKIPFNLEQGPILRMSLLRVEDDKYLFYYNMHHLISDGISIEILKRDVLAFYEEYSENKQSTLEELRIQYKDYSVWQLAQFNYSQFNSHKAFWENYLSGELAILDLPSSKLRPRLKTYNGQGLSTCINKELTLGLKSLSEENGGSLFMGLIAVWSVLMYRYTSQTDIILGTPVSGREHIDLENQIGFYVNTLVLRNEVKPEESFTHFFERVKSNTLNVYNHQMYPFDHLIDGLGVYNDVSRNPFFDISLSYHSYFDSVRVNDEVCKEEIVSNGASKVKNDIEVHFKEERDFLSFDLIFNTDIYDNEMIQGLIVHFKQLLAKVLENSNDQLGELDFLSNAEKHQLIVDFNDTQVAYSENKVVMDLFEEQATNNPEKIALVFKDKKITYRELNERTNQFANYLLENHNIESNTLIGIQLEKSEWMIIAILGVLKAGAAYIPIDPDYPVSRKEFIMNDSELTLLITETEFLFDVDFFKGEALAIDVEFEPEMYSRKSPEKNIDSQSLAYIIYTSGSTGVPKGVMIEHSGLVNMAQDHVRKLHLSPVDNILQFVSFSFDGSVLDIFMTYAAGATLVVVDRNVLKDPSKFIQFIDEEQITVSTIAPAYLRALNRPVFKTLRVLITAGESAYVPDAQFYARTIDFYNAYGPTECTVNTTLYKVNPEVEYQSIPIGMMADNKQGYVVNDFLQLQPIGVVGEIVVSGVGLAKGYLNREDLTNEKFINNPFINGNRLYKTGDLGRRLSDGNIEFIGRKDNQVKIRGHRIELGEIEHTLLQKEELELAVVLAIESANNGKELVAFVKPKGKVELSELQSHLRSLLPEYMIPTRFTVLDEFPVNSNGKIDKNRLLQIEAGSLKTTNDYIAPNSNLEREITKIWQDLLGVEKIGIKDDFFDLGGHSLIAVKIVSEYYRSFAVKLLITDIFKFRTIEAQARQIELSGSTLFQSITKVPVQESYAVSDAQRRLWVLSQFEESSIAYNIPVSIRLDLGTNIEHFEKAIYDTIERHEILRTVFKQDDEGELKQWVLEMENFPFEIQYRDFGNDAYTGEAVQKHLQNDAKKLFDLENGPLIRAEMLKTEDEVFIFYFNMHHIISDKWSTDVLYRDVRAFYEAYQKNEPANLEELSIQYKDYAAWQQDQLEEEKLKEHKEYWLDKLSGELPGINLPSNKRRPNFVTYNGRMLGGYLSKEQTRNFKRFIQEKEGSLYMGLLAAWNVLMHRYTEETDILIGTPVAGRPHADLENQIGFYLNLSVFRNEIDPTVGFSQFFENVKESTLEAFSHQVYPFDRLVDELSLGGDGSRHPIFDTLLDVHTTSGNDKNTTLSETEINDIVDFGESLVKYDMAISCEDTGDFVSIVVNFNEDVYEREMVEQLIKHYKLLIEQLIENPNEAIGKIEFISQSEKQQLIHHFNQTDADYPTDKKIIQLFEEQVANVPENIAVVAGNVQLSYREVNERANRLGNYLRETYTLKPDDLVAVLLDRSEWLIVAILGILKSGAAYVPIDPEYPKARIDFMLEDSMAKALIDQAELDRFIENQYNFSSSNPESSAHADSLAFVIYTSGSTGMPKGAMIEHGSLANYLQWGRAYYGKTGQKLNFGLFTSLSFDLTITSLFLPLITGGRLDVFEANMDVSTILENYTKSDLNVIKLTPAHINILSALDLSETNIEVAIVGGDVLTKKDIETLSRLNPEMHIYNEYGPTESTVGCIVKQVSKEDDLVLIGQPIANTKVYILSEELALQPVGVTGELGIGGAGLARGYVNKTELTHEKFIAHPFKQGERIYKTGDLGRWLPNGEIEFLGRKDDQIKIKGYRIELNEIEQTLLKNAGLTQALVLANENAEGEKELVAYFTASETQSIKDLRRQLSQSLPAYMLPSHFMQLEAFPLTSNGKIDKKSLPAPEGLSGTTGVEYIPPKTEKESLLASVWSDVLKRDKISIKDSFYNLGGDSIKSIQVVARLKQKGYRLKVEHILRTPVLESLALLLSETTHDVVQGEVTGAVMLTPIQHWFFGTEDIKTHHHYNQSVILKSEVGIDHELLEKCLSALTQHHDTLRMVYDQVDGTWHQMYQSTSGKSFTLDFYDLSDSENGVDQIRATGEVLQSTISLKEGPLIRVAHFRLKDGDRIGLVVHHLVIDGVSWRILLEDLSTLYAAYITGEKPELPQKTDAFQKWASAQNDYANSKALLNERSYWEGISTSEITALPQDIEVSNQVTRINAATSFYLDRGTTETLQTRVHQVYRTEINDVLLTALGLALRETFKVDKVALKMEGHGREDIFEHIDINRTIGWFTTVYPFVLDVSKSSNEIKNLLEIKESLRKIPNKGIGYGMLKYLSQQGLANELTPEITFNYLGDFGSNTGNSEKSLFEYGSEYFGANIGADNRNDSILDVSGMLVQGELSLSIGYSSERYHEETIKGLAASYKKNLELIIETLAAERTTHLTPSDLTFKGLTTDELSKLNSDGNVEDIYELSPLQEGIYYHWLNDESPTLYLEQKTYRIKAKNLSIENLKTAYERLINRYGALRTHFTNNYANKPLQVVLKQVESSFNFVMAPFGNESNKFADEVKQKDRLLGFDLEQGIQMRLTIVQLSKEEYEFIWSHHHILMDGWCISVLISDFNQLFYALTNGVTTNLSAITPYSNYINWLKKINRENSLGFWKKYLENYDTVAGLPFKVKSQEGGYSEGKESVSITGEIFQKVNALCVQIGITQNTYVQGVWGYLLSRYNNTNDAVFGAVVSGRPADLEGVEDMIGLFSNAVPIRVKYQPNDTPIELLKSLQDRSIESEAHHYLNLSEVQSQSELGMDLINHIMLFQNYAVKEVSEVNEIQEGDDGNLHIESVEDFNQNNYDFTIVINPIQDGLNIEFRYNSNLYANGVLKYLVKHMYNLVSLFSLQPTSELKSFEFLSEFERDKLLYTFNRDEKAYPKDKTIIDLFEEQVAKNPESSAIVFEGRTLTYKELNNKANQLAHYLVVNNEIESEDLVGILLERGIWQIIAILGVLKSGGAYVPIDPDLPVERKEFMIEDTGIKTLITESSFVNDIDFYDEAVVAIDIELDEEVLVDFDRNQSKTLPNNAAYVIYTSGSTGQPKGTIIEHKALCNLCSWHTKAYQLNSTSRATIMAGVAFDASVWELFPYLISGGCLYPISNETRLDLGKLIETMNDHEITHAYLPTVLYNDFFEQSSRLKRIVKLYVGGEALSVNQQGEMIELYNNYGPTENTVVASYYKVRKEDRGPIPIGQPIDNTSIYILNNENQLQPIGVIGEISIGGDGLARAYLNRPELTNEKFIENPFKTDEKIYKTGDLGRWTHEGNIEFVGRVDDQVKIRGYRIELGEIEHALSKFDGIDQAVVLAKANKHGVHELVAYLTSENAQNVIEIRTHLKEHLPAYMLPTHYVKLDAFSLTSNGKIDKKSLPDPDGIGVSSGEDYVPPRNEIEEKLVLIWSETLERENIGIKDDFFVMGGNSIKILNVLSRINQVFDIELKTRNLFETRSIEDLSVLVDFAIVQKEKGSMIDNMNEIEI